MSDRKEIFIDDLAKPVHTDMQKMAIEFGEQMEFELTPESIMEETKMMTGLDDFGPMDFVGRLKVLCEAWDGDEALSGVGRMSLRNKLVQHVSSRLLIQDQFNRHPEILDIDIEKPIIVAGLPRSGTTHLLNLMAADSRLRALPLWESYEPVPRIGESPHPGEEGYQVENDPRYKRCDESWQMMQQVAPLLAVMHPMNPEHIHEELELMGPNIGSYNYEWLAHTPAWRDYYYAEDQTPHYEYMKNILKLLTWQQRDSGAPTRWVLKCPQHLEQLPVLHKVFPDATIVITHRDPVSVIQSAITMLAYGQRMNRKQPNIDELSEYWCERIEHLLRACAEDRPNLPESQSIDVPFHELIADDLGTVEKIYAKAGMEMSEDAKVELQQFLDQHSNDEHGKIRYDLKKQFGIDPVELSKRFDFYFEQFPAKKVFK